MAYWFFFAAAPGVLVLANFARWGSFQQARARFLPADKTVEIAAAGLRSKPSPEYHDLRGLPPDLLRALIFQEDQSFYHHRGYSLRELGAAVVEAASSRRRVRGASTITQQLARTLFLSRERSFERKLVEWRLAALLERGLGKRRILELYLNHVYFGRNRYGIGPAARFYYGTTPDRLRTREVAYLISLLPNPEGCPVRVACSSGGQSFRYRRLLRELGDASAEKGVRRPKQSTERE